MESVLPSLLAVFALLASMLTLFRATDRTVDQLAMSWKEISDVTQDRVWTMVEIAEIEVAPDGRSLTITIGNAGQTNLFVYERFDVIIEYTDNGSGTWSVEALGFVPESPLAGQWAVTAITPDTIEPGFFNPGEQLTQLLHLTGEIQPLTANRVIVVTPNGASVTAQFTRE